MRNVSKPFGESGSDTSAARPLCVPCIATTPSRLRSMPPGVTRVAKVISTRPACRSLTAPTSREPVGISTSPSRLTGAATSANTGAFAPKPASPCVSLAGISVPAVRRRRGDGTCCWDTPALIEAMPVAFPKRPVSSATYSGRVWARRLRSFVSAASLSSLAASAGLGSAGSR